MPSEAEMKNRRRSERVFIRIPIEIKAVGADGKPVSESAEAVVVSRHGALIRVATALKPATQLVITHGFSRDAEKFRIVWVSERRADGRWDAGVEALQPQENFWGIRFPGTQP